MDPLQQSPIAPPPVSPVEAGAAPTNLSQEQMVASLQDLMEKIQSKYQNFNSQRFASDNKLNEMKSEALRAFFDMLQNVGIDPNSPEQVKAFLDKIRETNPELHSQIEKALNELLGEEEAIETGEISQNGMTPENMNINKNEAVQESI